MRSPALPPLLRSVMYICITVLILCGLSLSTSLPTAHAQTQSSLNQYLTPNTNSDVTPNLHTFTQSIILEMFSTVGCGITGVDFFNNNNKGCLGFDTTTGRIGYTKNNVGVASFFIGAISQLYIAPIHTNDYVQYVAQEFIPTKQAYAATTGTGFKGLTPFINIWKAFRNIAYLVYTVIFVLVGIAIILRLKISQISGNAAVNIETAIPKLIIGIVLVTFSYAIAGFMIDLMYVVTYIVVYVLAPLDTGVTIAGHTGAAINPTDIFANLNRPPMEFVDKLFTLGNLNLGALGSLSGGFGMLYIPIRTSIGIANIMANMLHDIIYGNQLVDTLPITWVFTIMLGVIFNFPCFFSKLNYFDLSGSTLNAATTCATQAIVPVAAFIIFIILYVILLFILFKVWLELIKSYALFLLDVLLGPFHCIFDPVAWLKNMAANLLVFPTTIFMFLIAKILIDNLDPSDGSLFIPPLVGNLTTTYDAGFFIHGTFIGAIAGFATLLLTPNANEMVKSIVKAGGNKMFGSAVGQGVKMGSTLFGAAVNPAIGKAWSDGHHAGPVKKWLGERAPILKKVLYNPRERYADSLGGSGTSGGTPKQ